jgi:AraC family transcriptional regulator, L-rhamnose operon transcriptional activator RhaR
MSELPVNTSTDLMHLTDGAMAYAGHWRHDGVVPTHTHSFVEVALVTAGSGVHHSLAGRQRARVGDVVLLRPGVWHGYEACERLDMFNCCFSVELLQHELAWTREDPLLGYLLWSGPYSGQRRGILTAHLGPADLAECVGHLDALGALRQKPMSFFRGDLIGRLSLFLSALARAVIVDGGDVLAGIVHATHPAVVEAMQMMEDRPAHRWTLAELSDALHLAPGYLVRLFKAATGLPPIAYLARHRVELAAARLLRTDEPIARIGESVGWPDQNYFARRFRSHYGMSATAYRSRFTNNAVRLRTWDSPPSRSALLPAR